jgi:SAM-dependent methyltransferase
MAASSPVGFDVGRRRGQILATSDRAALEPRDGFYFRRGLRYAAEFLEYHAPELALLPEGSTARFAGVGNPLRIGPLMPGETVLDHACGAGMDLLLAARRIGPAGRAIGVETTAAMRASAAAGARQAGLDRIVAIRAGLLEDLPVADESIDVVISNGVVSRSLDKARALAEIRRVLRPGGRLYLADVVVRRSLELDVREDPDLWAAYLPGAFPEPELYELAAAAGLRDGAIYERFDCFGGTPAAAPGDLRAHGVNFFARKPYGN